MKATTSTNDTSVSTFTEGPILPALIRFSLPVLLALCLQAMYGAVDLMIVGQFGTSADVSAVSTGSQMMHIVTAIIAGLSMGTTVLLGQKIGMGKSEEAGNVIGTAILLFAIIAGIVTVAMIAFAHPFATILHAPAEAFDKTISYVRICSAGSIFIIYYNVLGSVFRGLGDSKTPLLTVFAACICNIIGDLIFVAVFHWAAAGAAAATVLAQAFSVLLCLLVVKKKGLPFPFHPRQIRLHPALLRQNIALGFPIALQDGLVNISFLVILGIVNGMGVVASAGVGVAEKLCAFIMLVPSAFSQALSAFVAQNIGANKPDRARKAMFTGMALSFAFGIVMAGVSFFRGDLLSMIFSNDHEVVLAAWDYLKAYAIDTLLVSFLFCFIGYFNGCGNTFFVMIQGIVGAFCVRIPVSFLMSHIEPVSVFRVGLATPCSTSVQIVLCVTFLLVYQNRKLRKGLSKEL